MVRRSSPALAFIVLLCCGLGLVLTAGPVGAEGGEGDPVGGHAEAADDPWLSEEGPPVPAPTRVSEEQVVAAWNGASEGLHARGRALRHVQLEYGLGSLGGPANAVLAAATEEDPHLYSVLARDLAPDVPAIQMAHVLALWKSGDIGAATGVFIDSLWVTAATLGPQLWLFENVAFLLLLVMLGASLAFILLATVQVFSHAAHDLGDLLSSRTPGFARAAALSALLLIPLALGEGVVGLALAGFALAFAYSRGLQRNTLVLAAIMLVVGLFPLGQVVAIATTLVEQDPIAHSTMQVIAGTETRADVERLERASAEDPTAAHALAYRARRHGMEELSQQRMEALLAQRPNDGVVLANLGNLAMRRGDSEAAISLYERAEAEIDSPTLLFDLGRAYASTFRMEEYETAIVRAQKIDDEAVAALSALDDARLVADLGFPVGLLSDRLLHLALAEQRPRVALVEMLAPGRLGERWFLTVGAFALVTLLCLLLADRFDHASRCGRCGHRICTRCEETVWSEDICDDCHHLFEYPEATDPSLRMARLQALSQREVRIDRLTLAGSLLIPGVAGFAARRPDFAMFGLLLFGWVAAWVAWPTGVFEDPLLMGTLGILFFAVPGCLAVIVYSGIVFASLVVRKNR